MATCKRFALCVVPCKGHCRAQRVHKQHLGLDGSKLNHQSIKGDSAHTLQ